MAIEISFSFSSGEWTVCITTGRYGGKREGAMNGKEKLERKIGAAISGEIVKCRADWSPRLDAAQR